MRLFSIVMIYGLFWVLTAFMVMPFGLRTPQDDKNADMADRLSALEATMAELSKTIEEMRDAAADHVLHDGPDDVTPDSTEMTDDDYNGTYSTFDDLYED